jgi:apolipoprotein N-acyltransferase
MAGTGFLAVSNGRWNIAIAAWFFPYLFLRYFRARHTLPGIMTGAAAFVAVYLFMIWFTLDFEALSPAFRIVSGVAYGLVFLVPFIADHLIAARIPGPLSTLLFPCVWVTVEYLLGCLTGTWFSLAYTQYGHLPLMQIVSVTGIWGISFLVAWFGSALRYLKEIGFSWSMGRWLVCGYAAVAAAVLGYGWIRIHFASPVHGVLQSASIVNDESSLKNLISTTAEYKTEAFRDRANRALEEMMGRSRAAAQKGAGLVAWQEYALCLPESDEAELVRQGGELARTEGVHLVMAVALLPGDFPNHPWVNKLIWVGPDGRARALYQKSKPARTLEPIMAGKGIPPVVDTVWGKIAAFIGADLDYPQIARQAAKPGAGLLLAPSLDWKAVATLHTRMGVFRSIENGCSLIRAAGQGQSIAVDGFGRTLATLNYFNSPERIMFASVPMIRAFTLYTYIGDLFAWLAMAGTIFLCGRAATATPPHPKNGKNFLLR